MSFDRECENCKRTHWQQGDQTKPIEVCHSSRHDQWLCAMCHFRPTEDELKGNADAG